MMLCMLIRLHELMQHLLQGHFLVSRGGVLGKLRHKSSRNIENEVKQRIRVCFLHVGLCELKLLCKIGVYFR